MRFTLLPTIDIMLDLYEKPRGIERFQEYLKTLQGDSKDEFVMPVHGFNPMAKDHVLDRLRELKRMGAEQIAEETMKELNALSLQPEKNIKVALNLSDDVKGGWTNRYTSDYDSKFKTSGLLNRNFCVPLFWVSESFSEELIRQRVAGYIYRTVYGLTHARPVTLRDHVEQEVFVARHVKNTPPLDESVFKHLDSFYKQHQHTGSYSIIFNFFYGDEASESLAFPAYGIKGDLPGYHYAAMLAV